MSKTDKTRPYHVKAADHIRERHNHTDGVCDIAGLPPVAQNVWRSGVRRGQCYYEYEWWRPEFRCGCATCSPDKVHNQRNRRDRHDAKRRILIGADA